MITIIIPCFNEEKHIKNCLESVLSFSEHTDQEFEVLVIDGMSTDNSRELVAEYAAMHGRVRLIDNPGRIQSCALNIGIRQSRGDWIMRLDAHTQYPPDYLRLCHETAIQTKADNTGGICITYPGSESYEAKLVQGLTTHRFGVGNSGFRTGAKAGPRDTVPFGFFRRDVFDRIGYFDERLVRTQDYEFNRRLVAAGGSIHLNPEIHSYYYNIGRIMPFLKKQLFRQGPYNAYMWYLAPYAFTLRHAVTCCFAILFWSGLAIAPINQTYMWLFIAVMALYGFLGFCAAGQQARRFHLLRHFFLLPIGFFLFHLSHGTGVIIGLVRLACRVAPVQKIKEPWAGAGKYRSWP